MRFLYFSIKFYPYWAIPLILIFGEMAYIFRRRGNRPQMMRMATLSGLLTVITILFFVFRWDVTLFPWIRATFLN